MALPRIDVPTYELVIPSTDEKIKFRPFLVKEEKILLIAMESGKPEEMIQAVKDIVDECTYNKLKLGQMPMFDVEYLFLNIRAKSVGEVSKLKVLCQDDMKTYASIEIDLNEVQVEVDSEVHTNKIELSDEMGVIMKYPTIDSFTANGIQNITAANMINVIASCIAQVYDKKGEEVFESKDSTQAELIDFVEQLNTTQFQEVQKFFDTMPRLQHTILVINPKTKVESEVTLTGLNDFFV